MSLDNTRGPVGSDAVGALTESLERVHVHDTAAASDDLPTGVPVRWCVADFGPPPRE